MAWSRQTGKKERMNEILKDEHTSEYKRNTYVFWACDFLFLIDCSDLIIIVDKSLKGRKHQINIL